MAKLSREELAEIATGLGHDDVRIEETTSGRRYAVSCSCGWGAPVSDGSGGTRPTITRATFAEAVRTCEWHVTKAVNEYLTERRQMGVSRDVLPRT